MKAVVTAGVACLVMTLASSLVAAELTSGLQPGDLVGAFHVEKRGGALNDGQEVGSSFCYRCMLGNKPVVMVFAHRPDTALGNLVQALDKKLAENDDQKLASFVNLIGPDATTLKAQASEFAKKYNVENVALVVPQENKNGPEEFELNPQADVTVTIYLNGKVVVSRALSEGQLNQTTVQAILTDTNKILK